MSEDRHKDGWISTSSNVKPSPFERVLLAIEGADYPVVGYYEDRGYGSWKACTDNLEVSCGAYCHGGMVTGDFTNESVTHWKTTPPLPNRRG